MRRGLCDHLGHEACRVPRSMPLAQAITGVPSARCGASAAIAVRAALRRHREHDDVGARQRRAMSCDTMMPRSSGMPGRRGLSPRCCDRLRRSPHRGHAASLPSGARGGAGQRRAPGAGADDRDTVERSHRGTPSRSGAGIGEARRRLSLGIERPARRAAERQARRSNPPPGVRRRPRRSSRHCRCKAPAAATISAVCALAATLLQRRADRLIGGDAAGGDQCARHAESLAKQLAGRRRAGPAVDFQHGGLERGAEIGDVLRLQRAMRPISLAHGRLQPGEREIGVRDARASAAERRSASDRRSPRRVRPAGRRGRAGRAASRPCRRLRPWRRRAWCRAAHSRRRRAPRRTGYARRRRGTGSREIPARRSAAASARGLRDG